MNSGLINKIELDEYLKKQSALINRALEDYLQKYPGKLQTIFQTMRYGVFPGGKRIRPILTLATGELFGAPQSSLLPFACAIEMVHTYSLIHDDLPALDDDDLRRGEATAHKVFGDGMALLAGDALLTEAFHLMSSPDAMRCAVPELILQLIHELSHAAGVGGLVGGQALDLEVENQDDVDLATVEWIHVRKTGALILASVRIGAQVAGAQPADLARVSRYGERLGLAFQIADDILDALGQTAAGEGVESSHNERRKATYPSVVGLPQARETLKELLQLCLDELSTYGAQAAPLRAIARRIVARAIHGDAKSLSEEINV